MKARFPRLEASVVASQAYGRWLEIFQYLCPGMFDEAIQNLGQHVRCPLHGGEKDFRFIKRASNGKTTTAQTGVAMCTCGPFVDGFSLLQRALNKGFHEVLRDVNDYLNGHAQAVAPAPALNPQKEETHSATLVERLRSLWNAGKPVTTANFTEYFVSRGLSRSTLKSVRNLRFIPRLGYYDPPAQGEALPQRVGSFPALLGLLQDAQGKPVSIHRTWLSEDQKDKAPVDCPKKLTQSATLPGSAIRLFQVGSSDTLALCEGIETALAVRELSESSALGDASLAGLPVWACYSANGLRSFQLPKKLLQGKRLRKLVIFSDNDESETGMKAAQALKKRFEIEHPHIQVSIQLPEVMGWDWLDFLVSRRSA